MSLQVDQVIKTYLLLRERKSKIEAEAKEQVKQVKEDMAKLENWLLSSMNDQGVSSFKTTTGTAFTTNTDWATVKDWEATLAFIRETEAYDMLERRVSKIAVRSYIDEQKQVPPGVDFGTKVSVNIRKPTA